MKSSMTLDGSKLELKTKTNKNIYKITPQQVGFHESDSKSKH